MKNRLKKLQSMIEEKINNLPTTEVEANIFDGIPLQADFTEETDLLCEIIDNNNLTEDMEYLLANAMMDLESFPAFALQSLEEAISLLD